MTLTRFLVLSAICAASAFAQTPAISEILNNYSLGVSGSAPPGTIAQGAIFIVKGANLSDQSTGLQNVPLQTTLQGVRMEITVGSVTTFAPLYYVLPQQLAGILPSSTPTGTGTLIVRNNGRNSTPAPITIVRSAVGLLTASGAGAGAARVQNANRGYQELSPTLATNPGNILVFYGSGVGPVSGDETIAQVQSDLTTIPISVTIGGKPAQVLYRGRTVFPGLDQINVQVPTLDSGSYSCDVAVLISTNNVSANPVTIPVAPSGNTCTNPPSSGSSSFGLTPSEVDAILTRGSFRYGQISLVRNTAHVTTYGIGNNNTTVTTRTESATGTFQSVSGVDLRLFLGGATAPALGSCAVYDNVRGGFLNLNSSPLDPGASLTLRGAGGTRVLPKTSDGVYFLDVPGFLSAGQFTASGTGGHVGAFSFNSTLAPELEWTNRSSLDPVSRSSGLTVTWTGGDSSQPIVISGTSYTENGGAMFSCYVDQRTGAFTVPASILAQLPATPDISGGGISFTPAPGTLSISTVGPLTRTSATGVDIVTFTSVNSITQSVRYR